MDTTPFLDAIRGDLQAVTAGDESAAAVAERLSRALESSLQLRLLDAMGEAALELSDQLPSGHVEVRLAGRDVQLVVVDAAEPEPEPAVRDDGGGTARLTLRMPDALKARVEQAAASEGVSTNAWLVRAITRGLDRPPGGKRRAGSRITGYAQS
ncbi:MAG: toxin-antitoxin system HicB family antitoxin [Actinomycetota bacterium]